MVESILKSINSVKRANNQFNQFMMSSFALLSFNTTLTISARSTALWSVPLQKK